MPRHSQSLGSVRGVNVVIESVVTWMWGNNWKCRPEVNKFMKNWAYHSDIGKAAYDTVFGTA
jgi:hypothetical protein